MQGRPLPGSGVYLSLQHGLPKANGQMRLGTHLLLIRGHHEVSGPQLMKDDYKFEHGVNHWHSINHDPERLE